jgi:hypothetical protein
MNKRIIVKELNKLRVLFPKQSFMSNVLQPKGKKQYDETIKILEDSKVAYDTDNGRQW